MASEHLKKTLATLHQQLSRTPKLDEQSRSVLQQLMRDAENLAPAVRATDRPNLERHRLEELAVEFEAEHPDLAASVRELMDLLVKTGI
jgi:hypothetical protein